ncbi:uncharacterized protein LOC113494506 [Trichoplusia ni]|uniref:Uncharacterized protein LOC113494506 n=1 Tax=Trichoplusia ni TaxID=7111 RepID=A0A7E5VK62_TRINI|nr:uncharacterized protein LOC113494506 [Trichoplusia ni]
MGFDKHFNEDHCYLDESADDVAMNVDVKEEAYQISPNTANEQSIVRYLDDSGSSLGKMNTSSEDVRISAKKALIFLPYSEYCTDHKDLYLHEDEKLVKPGDKFRSQEDFVQYLNENAKRWRFYYKCSDSRKPNTENESFTYNCVYLRNKEKYKKKGLRKRNNNMKTDCPCKIKLRHLPNEKELTVVYVCNHHDHELSLEEFYKLQHGRRLPPHIKEEIMDLLKLKVDVMKIRAYVEMETGFSMSRPFFYALEKNMKSRNIERNITEDRLMMLREKIAAIDNTETSRKAKQRRSLDDIEGTTTPPLKRRTKSNDTVTSDSSKRIKSQSGNYSNEIIQSVKHLQESVKCEIQRNPWVSDQCVPVLQDRIGIETKCEESIEGSVAEVLQDDAQCDPQNELETYSLTIEYYNPEDNTHDVSNEFSEIVDEGQVNESEDSYIDNIAYETIVTEENHELQTEILEYVDEEQLVEENVEVHFESEVTDQNEVDFDSHVVVDQNDEIHDSTLEVTGESEEINEFDNTEVIEEGHIDYVTDNDNDVEYISEVYEENTAHDVGVQTADMKAQMLMPVFDVYMKDGNVTGFVVNDNIINGLKDGVHKGIQTGDDLILSDSQDEEDCDIIHDEISDTYTKHEYVHKYNIDRYMVQPHFPKYVETLAKETYMDVLHMFTNIYNEKAMFKLTTTQRGKEGNTKIWYITDNLKKYRRHMSTKERMKQKLQSVFVLKEKVRSLVKQNSELVSRNKQLEEVALKLVNMT